jgi:hypothetical protein
LSRETLLTGVGLLRLAVTRTGRGAAHGVANRRSGVRGGAVVAFQLVNLLCADGLVLVVLPVSSASLKKLNDDSRCVGGSRAEPS